MVIQRLFKKVEDVGRAIICSLRFIRFGNLAMFRIEISTQPEVIMLEVLSPLMLLIEIQTEHLLVRVQST